MAEQFNVGDQVYAYGPTLSPISRATVSRVTKTQAIVGETPRERRYNRQTGRLVGAGPWDASYIAHPTPELDIQYGRSQVRQAARVLSEAARMGDPDKIRLAFARWDRAETGSHGRA